MADLWGHLQEYYSVHGSDAVYVANVFYKTTTVIKHLGGSDNGIPSCTLSRTNAEIFLRDALLRYQLKVEIWAQSSAAGKGAATSSWTMKCSASPGNLQAMEDILFASSEAPEMSIIMAVSVRVRGGEKSLGIAFLDASQREIGVCEFVDNDAYSILESLLIQLSVKECLIKGTVETKDHELLQIRTLLQRCNVVVTDTKPSMFSTSDLEQDLNRLLGGENSVATRAEFELKEGMASTAALIEYLSLLSDEGNFGNYTLFQYRLSQFMKLDAAAVAALNLAPSSNDAIFMHTKPTGYNKTMSLQGLLDRCKTAQGSRLLGQWLKQPLLDIAEIRERQDMVQVFFDDMGLRES
ncbi:MSH2 protein, partial [Spiromyces aspiralis]